MKRSLLATVVAVAACSALIQWSSCGSSSSATPTPTPEPTAPTVTLTGIALATGTSTTIAASGTTGISGAITAPLTMTFSTAMDDATVNTGTTFSCPDGTTLTPTLASSDNTIYTITPASALPGITNCILSLANTIQDSSGNALTAIDFNYQTGCRTDDNFSTDTLTAGCWTQTNPPDASDYSVSIADNLLNMSVSVDPGEFTDLLSEYKIFGNSDLIATVSIPTFSGIVGSNDSCSILLYNPTFTDGIVGIGVESVTVAGDDLGKLTAHVITIADSGIEDLIISAAAGTSSAALSGTLYFRISQLGASTTVSYRIGSTGDFTTVGTVNQTFGATKHLGLMPMSDGAGDTVVCKFATFTVTDANGTPLSTTGQY